METTMTLTPFLSMNGKAGEAIRFYEKHLQAKVIFLKTMREMTAYDPNFQYDEAHADDVSHSVLCIGENQLMIADDPVAGDQPHEGGSSVSLCLESRDRQVMKDVYDSLVSDPRVKVLQPFEPSIFSEGYGVVLDPFGMVIQLNVTER